MEVHRVERLLKDPNMSLKTIIDWDSPQQIEQLSLMLSQSQADLESKMTQSIESHILGKQKLINQLKEVLPMLAEQEGQELLGRREPELESLVEMMEVREKMDYCLNKLEHIVNLSQD